MKKPLLVLTGPTAVGKTELSIKLAKALNGEIVSADSMQVYRHMDIGSAKITKEEMQGVPHHLIDVLEPWEEFHAAAFQRMAKEALEDIYSRGRLPIVTGGTGFYIQALLYDVNFSQEETGGALRQELERLAAEKGPEYLHGLLQEADPEYAASVHANNVKRVVRALEYCRNTGKTMSEHNRQEHSRSSPYHFLYYVLYTDRQALYQRIDRRVDRMMEQGLVEEVRRLKEMGCTRAMTSMQGLGYKEILDYLSGACTLEEAVYVLKRDTRHFAKRQITWFKRERDVRWLYLPDFDNDPQKVLEHILQEIKTEQLDCTGERNDE